MHMRDEASSFFNSNKIVEMQTQDQDPLLTNYGVEGLSVISPPPPPATIGRCYDIA